MEVLISKIVSFYTVFVHFVSILTISISKFKCDFGLLYFFKRKENNSIHIYEFLSLNLMEGLNLMKSFFILNIEMN